MEDATKVFDNQEELGFTILSRSYESSEDLFKAFPKPMQDIALFLKKYGVLGDDRMGIEVIPKRSNTPQTYLIKTIATDKTDYEHPPITLLKLTIYARQPVLVEYWDEDSDKKLTKDAIATLRNFVIKARDRVKGQNVSLKQTGQFIILTLQKELRLKFTDQQFIDLVKADMDTNTIFDLLDKGFNLEEIKETNGIPLKWLNKMM